MAFHLSATPALWKLAQVPQKLGFKILVFLVPLVILMRRKTWSSWLILITFLSMVGTDATELYASGQSVCQHAREVLEESGMARDAKEDFLGRIKRDPPYGSFPSDIDKVTWWGIFPPFEVWENPEFQAVWINPQGQEVGRQKFRGKKCRLVKTTVRADSQPRGEFQGGMWRVLVTCDDYLVDRQSFAVIPASGGIEGRDGTPPKQQPLMIWAEDSLDEKK